MADDDDDDAYNVVLFFRDGTYRYVQRYLDAREAVELAHRYCLSPGAQVGITRRIIITDSGDLIAFEWEFGKGVTFPLQCAGMQP